MDLKATSQAWPMAIAKQYEKQSWAIQNSPSAREVLVKVLYCYRRFILFAFNTNNPKFVVCLLSYPCY